MQKKNKLLAGAAGVAIAGAFAYLIVQNTRQQAATRDELNKLKQQMAGGAQAASSPAAGSPAGGPAVVVNAATRDGSALAREQAVNSYLSQGQQLISSGDPQKLASAVTLFQEAIDKVDGQNANFYSGLGQAQLLLKHFPEATQAYHRALELSPKRSDLWVGLGAAYWGVKDYYHAKVAYEEAIALNPTSIDAWSVMAWVYMGLGDKTNSVKGFQVLVDSGSDRLAWKTGLTMARAGNITVDQVRTYFPMPDPGLFAPPAGSSTTAAAVKK
ncbi:MAG TPA: tetratricopeptide repeat protein [Phycisphaerae bacterium]